MTPAPRIGTEFAGYRIEGLLGRGGMGVVYRAEHPRLGATVALKVMDPELAMNETFRERFVREARAAAQIKHPFSPRNGRAASAKLRGLVFCATCGRRLKVSASGRRGHKKAQYVCTAIDCSAHPGILAEKQSERA